MVSACATTPQGSPSAAEILRALSQRSGQPLVTVVGSRPYESNPGSWYVKADTFAKASSVSGLCESTRVLAVIRRVDRSSWTATEVEQATAVAINKQNALACERVPAAAFFDISARTKLSDIELVMDAFDQMRPCARKRENCEMRVTATPSQLLELVSQADEPPTAVSVDLNRNLSNESVRYYEVEFSLDVPTQRYGADITIAGGRIESLEIGRIVQ